MKWPLAADVAYESVLEELFSWRNKTHTFFSFCEYRVYIFRIWETIDMFVIYFGVSLPVDDSIKADLTEEMKCELMCL